MASRLGIRFGQTFRSNFQSSFQSQMRFAGRRFQGTAAHSEGAANESAFSKLWNSSVGPKTVHFWAPVMKWGLVLAGASDFTRPASQLSITQNAALMCTGIIWTRWCFIIKPRNVFLASVNFCLFLTGATQVVRVLMYQSELKGQTLTEEVKDKAQDAGAKVKELAEDPSKIKQAAVGK